MNEIIKINYKTEQPTVSARDLYDLLSSEGGLAGSERFSKWFDRYIGYGFRENADYSTPYKKVRVQMEGKREVSREVEDYDLSVDMAKQICMLQRTDKGMEIRKYFIDLEKAWNTPEQIMARALKLADRQMERLKEDNAVLLQDNERMKPHAILGRAITTANTSILVGDLAKILRQNGIEIGAQRLFKWMRDKGYLIKRKGTDWNLPTQRSMEMGLFEIKESVHIDGNGCNKINRTTKITGKGQQYFVNKFLDKEG